MKLTQDELRAMPEKTKKDPAVVALYLEHDFLTAYAMHTDRRVEQNGPEAAIGAVKDWERHGQLQFDYLLSQGLQPGDRVLEVGCGTGRLARKLVPYLKSRHYVGVDISVRAIASARELSEAEGWADREPRFQSYHPLSNEPLFDFAWAFSVFIHLPAELITIEAWQVAHRLKPEGAFYFSYVPEQLDRRTGLKQFRHTLETYQRALEAGGLTMEPMSDWPGEQRIARARRIA